MTRLAKGATVHGIREVLVQKHEVGRLGVEERAIYHHCVVEGIRVRSVAADALLDGRTPIDADMLVVGSVEVVSGVLQRLGVPIPSPNYYPAPLRRHLHRRVWQTTREEIISLVARDHVVFAKSLDWKQFTGRTIDAHEGMAELMDLPPQTPMWAAEPVNWQAEWRVYVIERRIVGVGRYDSGADEALALDMDVVHSAVEALADEPDTPVAYAIDWGLIDGKTALVEMNDGWAIGLYEHLPRQDYFELLVRRWREMTHTCGIGVA